MGHKDIYCSHFSLILFAGYIFVMEDFVNGTVYLKLHFGGKLESCLCSDTYHLSR